MTQETKSPTKLYLELNLETLKQELIAKLSPEELFKLIVDIDTEVNNPKFSEAAYLYFHNALAQVQPMSSTLQLVFKCSLVNVFLTNPYFYLVLSLPRHLERGQTNRLGITIMTTTAQALAFLRQRIRASAKQYRHNDDTSSSLFHPVQGFTFAYDVTEVENALDDYEAVLPSAFKYPEKESDEQLAVILKNAMLILNTHPSKDAKDFALQVITFLKGNRQITPTGNLLRLLKTVDDVLDDDDN